jgi:hypothetical protein
MATPDGEPTAMTVGAARTPLALLTELMATFAGVALFVAVFGQNDGPAPSFVAVTVVALGSFTLVRALQIIEIDETAMRAAGVGVSVLALFIIARLEYAPDAWLWDLGWLGALFTDTSDIVRPNAHVIAGVVALAPVWFRGVWRGVSSIEFDGVLTSASLGLLAVIIAAMASPDTREPVSWGAYALAYAALALVTLALYQAPEPQATLASFAKRWTVPFATIGGVAIGLALVAAAIDPDAFGFLAPIGEPLRVVGNLVGTYVLGPIIWVGMLPFRFLFWILGVFFGDPGQPPRPIEQEGPLREEAKENGDHPLWQRLLVWTLFGGAGAAVTAIALVVLWYAFRRFARDREMDDRERREDIEPASSLRDDLSDLLAALRRRLRPPARPQSAVQIRRLYFDMLDAASARGLVRPEAATPLQFAPALDAHFASEVPSSISRAFAASRYGELPIDPAEVRSLRARWDVVHRGGRHDDIVEVGS